MRLKSSISCFLLLISVGCGYQFYELPDSHMASTISIPYVEGDLDGCLTEALVQKISSTGKFIYKNAGADQILYVKVVDDSYDSIGFRYDRSRKGKLKNWVIPVEIREKLMIELKLVDAGSGNIIYGPNRLMAEVEYDHDYYTVREGVNIFSLGQLTDIDSAEDAAKTPLYRKIAEKVAYWLLEM